MAQTDIILNNVRIQILDKNLIRIEQKFSNKFIDENTFLIPDRSKFKGYKYETIENSDSVIVFFDEYKLVVSKNNPLNTVLYQNNKIIYKFNPVKNTGELPKSYETPNVFVLNDAPHIFVPKEGYTIQRTSNYTVEENDLDCYLMIVNKDPNLLRKLYVELTGKSDLVRFKTLGLWHSRYYKYTQKEAVQMIDKWMDSNLPFDNFVIDTDWRKANDIGIGYEIDTNLFPNMSDVFKYAHDNNVTVMFNDHPEPYQKVHNVFSSDEIKFRETHLQKILAMGLDTWWYDRNWITKLISPTKGIEPETFGLYLFNDITRNFYEKKEGKYHTRPDIMGNVNNISNGNYLKINDSASHRYPIQWTGDTTCDRSSITKEVINLIRGSENEISYIHYDVGGHIGNPDKHLYLDWIKFAAFTPIFRLHCTNGVKIFREPWNYDEETVEIFKKYLNMRYRLLPYLYSLCYKNYEDGEPIFKSLSYDYKNSYRLRKIENEYILGKNILVAPNGENIGELLKQEDYVSKVSAQFFDNENLKGEPIISQYNELNIILNHESPIEGIQPYNFSAVFKTSVSFKEDTDLYVRSDDGIRVYVNNELIVDDWTYHGALETFVLTAKKDNVYNLKIEYLQGGGEAEIQLIKVKKCENRIVVLPENKWIDAFNGRVYSKRNQPTLRTGLNDISLFIKEGSIIPLVKAVNNTSKLSYENIMFECFPSEKVNDSGFIYEDDRHTIAYKFEKFRKTNYSSKFDSIMKSYNFRLEKAVGDYEDHICNRKITFKIHLFNKLTNIKSVLINNEPVEYKYFKKNENLYPFGEELDSNISEVIVFELDSNINNDYDITVIFK